MVLFYFIFMIFFSLFKAEIFFRTAYISVHNCRLFLEIYSELTRSKSMPLKRGMNEKVKSTYLKALARELFRAFRGLSVVSNRPVNFEWLYILLHSPSSWF